MNKKEVGFEYADLYFRFPEITDDEIDEMLDFLEEEHICCEGATDIFIDKDQQITQLTNNWNELEEWVMQDVKDEKPDLYFQVLRKIDILDKMKKIKEKNDKSIK